MFTVWQLLADFRAGKTISLVKSHATICFASYSAWQTRITRSPADITYLADDVICFVSFLDQKMLDKVTVKVSLWWNLGVQLCHCYCCENFWWIFWGAWEPLVTNLFHLTLDIFFDTFANTLFTSSAKYGQWYGSCQHLGIFAIKRHLVAISYLLATPP